MQEQNTNTLTYLLGLLLSALTFGKYYLDRHLKLRIHNLRKRTSLQIDQSKIIVAIEPNNLFFELSTHKTPGFTPVDLPLQGWEWLWARLMSLFGKGLYYRSKEPRRNISLLLKSLTQNNSLQLFLYTTLSPQVVSAILRQMDLLHYFPQQFRRSCEDASCQYAKHPIEVDVNTKRVVIVTPSRQDHCEEDSKYFLVARKKQKNLGFIKRTLEELVDNNTDIDELHNELSALKDHIQSEIQGQ